MFTRPSAMVDQYERIAAALAGQYRLERELGHGGMARVYLALDVKHGRKVALKLLRPELSAMIGVDRFLAEIRTMASLSHPRILPLFDSGIIRLPADASGSELELPFYVMPHVAGETLRARLDRERQLPVPTALGIAAQVSAALDHAHRHGVIHRDIKPENILLDDGEAVVADFGIALALDAAATSRLTETGLTLGTPVYMSPEQLLGERNIDGRSDLYSLGCVLYEMLAGEPPHTGHSPQAIAAKRLSQVVPPVHTMRETVPPAVDAALAKVLSKSPADRFATAREFAVALGATVESTPLPMKSRPSRRWRLPAGAVAVAVLLAAGAWIVRGRDSGEIELEPDRLAVAPFDVTDPDLEVWHEGVVDVLARTIDGAGSLRVVSPSVVLRDWAGRSDRASAMALGRRTGAGVVVTGDLSQLDADRVRLRATLLDVEADDVLGDVEVEGPDATLGALVDSLGLGILRTLSRTRPVAAVRQAAIASVPLGALKAFLVGEQEYRRGSYDAAAMAYDEALALDSSFALASYRMAQVLGWNPPNAAQFQPGESYALRAYARIPGLSARDSLLLSADSLAWAAGDAHPDQVVRAMALREEAARRFPDDPEVWLALGEARYHSPAGSPQALPRALAAFERAIELDSGFVPAYEHVIEIALRLGRFDRALHHARAAAELRTTAGFSASVRLASRLLLLPDAERAGAVAALDSAPVNAMFDAGMLFMQVPDSNETALALFRELDRRQARVVPGMEQVTDSAMRTRYVVGALIRRGHMRDAMRLAGADLSSERTGVWFHAFQDPVPTLAFMGVLPLTDAEGAFAPGFEAGLAVTDGYERRWRGLAWWSRQRDTASLARFELRMREAVARGGSDADLRRASYFRGASAGYLALARGDTANALKQFESLPDSLYCALVSCIDKSFTQARLLAARGEDASAAEILDRWIPWINGGLAVVGLLDRARIAERLGDIATAQRAYRHVAEAWRNADPELAGYAAEAREGLARVSARTK